MGRSSLQKSTRRDRKNKSDSSRAAERTGTKRAGVASRQPEEVSGSRERPSVTDVLVGPVRQRRTI